MGIIIREISAGKRLTWFGRGMNSVRAWEDRHPLLRKAEFAPAVAAGGLASRIDCANKILSMINELSPIAISANSLGYLAGTLLFLVVLTRNIGLAVRRNAIEEKVINIAGLSKREQARNGRIILGEKYASWEIKVAAAEAVGRADPGAIAVAASLSKKNKAALVLAVFKGIGQTGPASLSLLLEILERLNGEGVPYHYYNGGVVEGAIAALGEIRAETAVPLLKKTLLKVYLPNEGNIKAGVIRALGRIEGKHALEAMRAFFDSYKYESGDRTTVLTAVAETLGEIGDPAGIPLLEGMWRYEPTSDRRGAVSRAAAEALGKIGGREVIPALAEYLNLADFGNTYESSPTGCISHSAGRRAALAALVSIGGPEVIAVLENRLRQKGFNEGFGGSSLEVEKALARLKNRAE